MFADELKTLRRLGVRHVRRINAKFEEEYCSRPAAGITPGPKLRVGARDVRRRQGRRREREAGRGEGGVHADDSHVRLGWFF